MDERGITKGSALGLIVIVGVIIAAGYVLLSGGGKTAELEVGNLVFCSGETRSYGMYDEQPDNTYSKEEFDKIYVYVEVDNLGTEPAGEKEGVFRTWLVVDPVVKQDGDVVDDPIEKGKIIKFEEETIKRGLYVQRALNIRDIPPGTYTLELEIKDQYSKDKETLTGKFTLVE